MTIDNTFPNRNSGAEFNCNCGGSTEVISGVSVWHACKHKYSPSTSFYDGIPKPIRWVRATVNPELTDGVEMYNWMVDWVSTTHDLDVGGICKLCDAGDPTSVLKTSDEPCPGRTS